MSTSLPEELQLIVNAALAEVNVDPQHRLAPQRRRQIYDAFKASTHPVSQRAQGWLAVITARRVLDFLVLLWADATNLQNELIRRIESVYGLEAVRDAFYLNGDRFLEMYKGLLETMFP